ncbi:MAG: hypothetical protein ABH804_02785 [archaeon]
MGILEQVTNMKKGGMSEEEISTKLKEQGISPKEIISAISQAQIKNAVVNNEEVPQPPTGEDEYIPSKQNIYTPKAQEAEYQPQYETGYYQPQEYYPQEGYEQYPQTSTGTDTMIEIAEQVLSEKIKEIKSQLNAVNEFKVLTQTKIDVMSEKLKRIETIIDNLQIQILEKVGSYGNNLENIKKEMSMMQDSFTKMISDKASHKKTHKK